MRPQFVFGLALAALFCSSCLPAQPGRFGRQTRQSNEHARDHASLRRVFAPAIKAVHPAVVEVLGGDEVVALGTVLAPSGLVVTKASELGDQPRLRRPGKPVHAAEVVYRDEANDLAVLRAIGADWVGISLVPVNRTRVGSWLVSAEAAALPLAIGVMSTPPHARRSRAYLGVRSEADERGVRISEVLADSGAAKAGIQEGDVILSLAGAATKDPGALRRAIIRQPVGATVPVRLLREDAENELRVTLGQQGDRKGPMSRQERGRLWGPLSEVRLGMEEVIQHDSVLRPEHCGSPLCNLDGEVVGINIARVGRHQTLALTAKLVARILAQAEKKRSAKPRRRVIR